MNPPLPEPVRTLAYIDGAFVPASDGGTFDTYNPATGTVLTTVAACTEEDVDVAVAAARRAFEEGAWRTMPLTDRRDVLLRLVALLEANVDDLALLESIDSGKPITDCRDFDLPDTIHTIRWYAEAIDKYFGRTTPNEHGALGLIVKEPVGVVAAVLPWNFPLAMLAWKIGPALAAGNSVVVKPPALTTLTTLRLAELAGEAGVPAGVLNVVPGRGGVLGKALGMHPDVDAVTFTGSNDVGRQFLHYSASSNLKHVVLEMGGKSPQVVTADNADRLDLVAEDLSAAAFWNMGQNCSAGSRILVDTSIADDVVAALVTQAATWTVGDPQDPATRVGPLVEKGALERVAQYVKEAQEAGANVACGGEVLLAETGGWFYAPTVLTDVTPDMAVAREEIFGPVVVVLTFETLDEAVALANDCVYGLAATVWSRDIDTAMKLARDVRAGTVAVNGYSEGSIATPFGGYKESGFGGRDNGLEAFDQYTETKSIWVTLR